MKIIKTKNRICTAMEFNQLVTAKEASRKNLKPSMILLGDNDLYWVCSLGDAACLILLGYEPVDAESLYN